MNVVPRTLRGQVALVVGASAFVPFVGLLVTVAQALGRTALPVVASVGVLAAALVVVFVLCLAAGLLLARHVTNPMQLMAIELRLARPRPDGTVGQLKVKAHDPYEIRDLKRSVNDILNRAASEATQRQAVLAMLAHDMKNPLLGTVRVLEQARRGSVHQDQWLGGVLDEQRRLLEVVSLIVQASKYESDEVRYERKRFDLKAAVDRVVERQGQREGLAITTSGTSHVIGDEGQIERVVENLVENAVRCARSRVSIDMYPGVLRVCDDGPGLPASLTELASPFRSERLFVDGLATPTGMAGLGLYIVRRIIEDHNGRLVVESTGDAGTTILAYLPG